MRTNIHKFRWLQSRLPNKNTRRIVLLTGARQTGKTTLAKTVYPDINYINLDDAEKRSAIRSISASSWNKSIGMAIIDEAQKEPSLFEKLKYSYDGGETDFSVLLGSSQILLLKKIKEALAGRVFIYELWPLMFSEFFYNLPAANPRKPLLNDILQSEGNITSLLSKIPEAQITEEKDLTGTLQYFSNWGGMPELLFLNDSEKKEWLRSYEYTYLERDLSDLARLNDLEPFRAFQRISSLRSAQLLSYSQLARDSQISVSTARRYLEYLRISYQAILVPPFYTNLTSQVVKTPKIFWVDVGLLRQISGYFGPVNGSLFETMVFGELHKWIKTEGINSEIYFYRTRAGLEVDFIIKTEGGFLGIEVKYRNKIDKSDYTNLSQIAKAFDTQWRGGIVIYNGNTVYPLDKSLHIWAIPFIYLFT